MKIEWTKKKPKFTKDCLLLVASRLGTNTYEYTLFEIKRTDFDGSWYMGWFAADGDEYGDLKDLRADLYCVMPYPY